jgi:hypothetical protein
MSKDRTPITVTLPRWLAEDHLADLRHEQSQDRLATRSMPRRGTAAAARTRLVAEAINNGIKALDLTQYDPFPDAESSLRDHFRGMFADARIER